MLELWITVKAWLIAESISIGPLTGIAAVALALRWPFKRDKPTQLAPETIDQIKPPQAKDGPALRGGMTRQRRFTGRRWRSTA